MRQLLALAWLEAKIFVREPMGVLGGLLLPVFVFVGVGRAFSDGRLNAADIAGAPFNIPILAALTIAIGNVMSLVTIMAIYREGGILKRLRATPLSPVTILTAHVLVKLAFTGIGFALLVIAGRLLVPGALDVDVPGFAAALLIATLSLLSTGFVIASVVPTARFAQPIGAACFYPMMALSGLFFPIAELPRPLELTALALPTTHATALMLGIWNGSGWQTLWPPVLALAAILAVCVALSARIFRWE